jgi:hypothetical protein
MLLEKLLVPNGGLRLGDGTFGVLSNPFGRSVAVEVGQHPNEDCRYFRGSDPVIGWTEDLTLCVENAERIAAELRLAVETGWELIDDVSDGLFLRSRSTGACVRAASSSSESGAPLYFSRPLVSGDVRVHGARSVVPPHSMIPYAAVRIVGTHLQLSRTAGVPAEARPRWSPGSAPACQPTERIAVRVGRFPQPLSPARRPEDPE